MSGTKEDLLRLLESALTAAERVNDPAERVRAFHVQRERE